MVDRDNSSIERMKRRLYSRSRKRSSSFDRTELHEHPQRTSVGRTWGGTPKPPRKPLSKEQFLTTLLVLSVLFFVISAGVAAYLFFGGSNQVSPENIDIEIQGPATTPGGDELTLQIAITNRNATAIETADLLVEYPDGTRSASNVSSELPRTRESLGTIKAGERIQKTARAVLFGEEGSSKEIKVILEYRVAGSNAIFFDEQVFPVTLSSAPVTISVDTVKEITSGQETTFTVTVTSNSDTIVEDVLLVAEYPFGFEFDSASPRPSFNTTVWELGDILPEGEQVITIRGIVLGEDEEERVFRFKAGIQSKEDEQTLVAAFVDILEAIEIKKPFIGVTLALDGSTAPEFVSSRNKSIRADLSWFNNLPTKVFDVEIEARIVGSIFDERSVSAQEGFYRSSDNTIVWNRETINRLAELDQGTSGNVSFSFAPLTLSSGSSFRDPDIHLDISIKGKRLSDRDVPETIESSITRTIKVTSDLLLTSRAVYFDGPIQNTGPLPPRAEVPTTYTILWSATNSTNAVSNVVVSATLPSYMRWTSVTSPAGDDIEFNENGGRVVWNVGTMIPGDRRDIAFQVSLSPSLSQIGTTVTIVNEQMIEGTDVFTRTPLRHTRPSLSTRLSTDSQFKESFGQVVE